MRYTNVVIIFLSLLLILSYTQTLTGSIPENIDQQQIQQPIQKIWESPDLGGWARSLSWSPEGGYIAVGLNDGVSGGSDHGRVVLLDSMGNVLWSTSDLSEWVSSVVWSLDGSRIIAGSNDWYEDTYHIRVYDTNGNLLWTSQNYDSFIRISSPNPSGQYLVGIGYRAYILDQNFQIIWSSNDLGGYVKDLSWSPSRDYFVVAGEFGIIAYRESGELTWSISSNSLDTALYSVAWSPDGEYIVAGGDNHKIYIITRYGEIIWESSDLGGRVMNVAWSPNGNYLIAGTRESHKFFIFSYNGTLVYESQDLGGIVFAVSWSPDGHYIAVGGSFNKVIVYKWLIHHVSIDISIMYGSGWNIYVDDVLRGSDHYIGVIPKGIHNITVSRDGFHRTFILNMTHSLSLILYYGFDLGCGWYLYNLSEVVETGKFIVKVYRPSSVKEIFIGNTSIPLEGLSGLNYLVLFMDSGATYNVTLVPADDRYYPLHVVVSGDPGEIVDVYPEFVSKHSIIIDVRGYSGTYKLYINGEFIGTTYRRYTCFLDPGVYNVSVIPTDDMYLPVSTIVMLTEGQSVLLNVNISRKPILHLYVSSNELFDTYCLLVNDSVVGCYGTDYLYGVVVNGTGWYNVTIIPNATEVQLFSQLMLLEANGDYNLSLDLYRCIGCTGDYVLAYSGSGFSSWLHNNSLGLIVAQYDCSCNLVIDGVSVSGCGSYLVPAGGHSIKVHYGDVDYSGEVDVGAGDTVELGYSRLILKSNTLSKAIVYIGKSGSKYISSKQVSSDGVSLDLYPGVYRVEFTVSSGAYTASQEYVVELGFNEERVVEAWFPTLTIKNVYGDLYIDNVFVDSYSCDVVKDIYVSPGKHKIRIVPSNPFYGVFEAEIDTSRASVVVEVNYPVGLLTYMILFIGVMANIAYMYISVVRPKIVVVGVEPLEIVEGVTKSLRIRLRNKGLKKARKHVTVRLGDRVLFDETITIPGKRDVEIEIPLE